MANPITIPEHREPTLWNRYALTGARVGLLAVMGLVALGASAYALPELPIVGDALAPAIGSLLETGSAWLLGIGAAAAGFMVGVSAYAGGLSGAREVEHNKLAGRTIYPPSLFNEGIGHGLMDGLLLAAAAITATALIVPTGIAAIALAFVGGAGLVGAGFLSYYQADAVRDSMSRDYMIAQQRTLEMGKGMAHVPSPEASLGQMLEQLSKPKSTSVTPDDMQQLSSRLREGNNGQSAVARLEEERLHHSQSPEATRA